MNKTKKIPTYPYIADFVLKSVSIPVAPLDFRKEYARPDTLRMYVPPTEEYESDEEERLERERNQLKNKYQHKPIKKVVERIKSETGQVSYKVIFIDKRNEPVFVSSRALQDHPDWALVEAFEYCKAKQGFTESDIV